MRQVMEVEKFTQMLRDYSATLDNLAEAIEDGDEDTIFIAEQELKPREILVKAYISGQLTLV